MENEYLESSFDDLGGFTLPGTNHQKDFNSHKSPDGNQDGATVGMIGEAKVLVVCDGVGGDMGKTVSKLIADSALKKIQETDLSEDAIRVVIMELNSEFKDQKYRDATFSLGLVNQGELITATLGDSRVYLVRQVEGKFNLQHRTLDHNPIFGIIEEKLGLSSAIRTQEWISKNSDKLKENPIPNIISGLESEGIDLSFLNTTQISSYFKMLFNSVEKSIGKQDLKIDEIQINRVQVSEGDIVLNFTDGFNKLVSDDEVVQIIEVLSKEGNLTVNNLNQAFLHLIKQKQNDIDTNNMYPKEKKEYYDDVTFTITIV